MSFFSKVGDFVSKIPGAAVGAVGNIAGSILSSNSQADAAAKNLHYQKEFAQNGIQWRVADAKAAGIHPLAALGAHTQSYSPVFQGTDYGDLGLSAAGQSIDRAREAKLTPEEREWNDLQRQNIMAQIDETRARTDQIRAQTAAEQQYRIASAQAATQQRIPAVPRVNEPKKSQSVDPVGAVVYKPNEIVSTSPDLTHGAGIGTIFDYNRVGSRISIGFNQDKGDAYSDDVWFGLGAKASYLLGVHEGDIQAPPEKYWTKKEKLQYSSGLFKWTFNPVTFSWKLKKVKDGYFKKPGLGSMVYDARGSR